MDSAITKHMTLHKSAFDTYEVISSCNMHFDNNSMAEAIEMGSIVIVVEIRGIKNIICITSVLHVPKLQVNLLSMGKLLSNGLKCNFT